jgi:DNA-binding MarR family transcriptional regulator
LSRENHHSEREALLAELSSLIRAGQRATDESDELLTRLLGINRTDGRCLDILDERGPMTAGQLATASGLTTGAITAVVDRLERAGYARRAPDPSDRRRVLVELTQKTRDATQDLFGPLISTWESLAARFSLDDLRLLIDFHRLAGEVSARHLEHLRERLAALRQERAPARPGR